MLCTLRPWLLSPHLCRCICRYSQKELENYKEAFVRRMNMAGIKQHHRIALGVSGGPDSVALCFLTAGWKLDGSVGKNEATGFINGLLGIVVDHRLRPESTDEALLVCHRVNMMGVQCEILNCDWSEGRPKLGHLMESARDMRYELFKDICIKKRIEVLLIAHHADDQAELLIMRLSRNSGVLGLAGMAFVSQLFSNCVRYCSEDSSYHSILLVRPMLEFSKDDMYKICLAGCEDWVEDPTNQSLLFARNRVRAALRSFSTNEFRSDIQSLISTCRLTRTYVEMSCQNLMDQSATVSKFGYAMIDLVKLKPLNVDDICLSSYVALIVQFISQRHKPVRGSTLKLLLNYIRKIPCKTSLSVASCYFSFVPQSKGMKILVSFSADGRQSLRKELSYKLSYEEQHCTVPTKICEIIKGAKSHSHKTLHKKCDLYFMHSRSSADVLSEARNANLISESTLKSIVILQQEEQERFSTKTEDEVKPEAGDGIDFATASSVRIQFGETWHFMSRFEVTWKSPKDVQTNELCLNNNHDYHCQLCMIDKEEILSIRHMIDADWLSLAKLLKIQLKEECQDHSDIAACTMKQTNEQRIKHHKYVQMSVLRALKTLRSIPLPARRALPVIVNSKGLLISIPNIGFSSCPCLSFTSEFKPRIPLGGGYSSYL